MQQKPEKLIRNLLKYNSSDKLYFLFASYVYEFRICFKFTYKLQIYRVNVGYLAKLFNYFANLFYYLFIL